MQRVTFLVAGVLAIVLQGCQCGTSSSRPVGADGATIDGMPIYDANGNSDVPVSNAPDVRAVVTADNSYGFGWGNATSLASYFGRPAPDCTCAGDIFNCPIGFGPEEYTVPGASAPTDAFLYIVAWADNVTTQGLIATFQRANGESIVTGDGSAWEVCATGIGYPNTSGDDHSLFVGPPESEINAEIARCNAGSGDRSTTSGGWVNQTGPVTPNAIGTLVVGETNESNGGDFRIACQAADGVSGIPANARWIWYSPTGSQDAFRNPGQNNTRTFLIFRIAATEIPIP